MKGNTFECYCCGKKIKLGHIEEGALCTYFDYRCSVCNKLWTVIERR